jgi:hypothetical protein
VWSEASVTVCVTEEPPQFVKFTTGHERIAPNDKPATIRRVERLVYEQCEAIVDERVRRLAAIVQAAQVGDDPPPARKRRRRSATS